MTTATTLQINETRREVARTIVKAIGDWLARPEGRKGSITVYIDKDGITDTYSLNAPADHVADLLVIDDWNLGERDESISYDDYTSEPFSDEEASAYIDLFSGDWLIYNIEHPELGEVQIEYAD